MPFWWRNWYWYQRWWWSKYKQFIKKGSVLLIWVWVGLVRWPQLSFSYSVEKAKFLLFGFQTFSSKGKLQWRDIGNLCTFRISELNERNSLFFGLTSYNKWNAYSISSLTSFYADAWKAEVMCLYIFIPLYQNKLAWKSANFLFTSICSIFFSLSIRGLPYMWLLKEAIPK